MNIRLLAKTSLALAAVGLSYSSLAGKVFTSITGEKIEGEVVKNFGDYLLFKRADDHQLFRFKTDILCDKDRAFVKNNFAPVREEIPKMQRPLPERQLLQLAQGALAKSGSRQGLPPRCEWPNCGKYQVPPESPTGLQVHEQPETFVLRDLRRADLWPSQKTILYILIIQGKYFLAI